MPESAPAVILGPYEPGLSAKRDCFDARLGRVTFEENNDGSAEAVLHDIKDKQSGEATIVGDLGITPIGLSADTAVIRSLENISAKLRNADRAEA